MNKVGATPNGPGMTMAEQAAFVNGRGTRLVGAPDSPRDKLNVIYAKNNREAVAGRHWWREIETANRLGKIIGTASRHQLCSSTLAFLAASMRTCAPQSN